MKNLIYLFILISFNSITFFPAWDEWNKRNRDAIFNVFTGKSNTNNKSESKSDNILTFKDYIGGVPLELQKVKEICNSENPSVQIHGILLEGLPGTGKTYLVKCLAGEIDAQIFTIDAATLMDYWVGSGPSKIKSEFQKAYQYCKSTGKPAIVFIDEFDSIGSRAVNDEFNGAVIDEKKKTINVLLAEMDGFKSDSKVIVIGATNRAQDIDTAFKRPGRFDYIIKVELPGFDKRKSILNYYKNASKIPLDNTIDMNEIAELTEGLSPADLKQIIEAVNLVAEKLKHSCISHDDIILALDSRRKVAGLNKINYSKVSNSQKVTFKDVIGGVPQEVADLKAFLENDEAFKAVGAERPKGIIFVGPTGTGKTLLAKSIAGELDAAFFNESASSFMEIYVGTGPKKIRDLFLKAEKVILEGKAKKAIIFIDELDAIGSRKNNFLNGEEIRTINELLVQLDGFNSNTNIIVIAATNKPESLDDALLRPGRFDYIVNVPLPDYNKRYALIEHYLFSKPRDVDPAIKIVDFAKKTEGFNCAELKDMVNNAAINAGRKNRLFIALEDMEHAFEQLILFKKYR